MAPFNRSHITVSVLQAVGIVECDKAA